jgi:hypothetical protein
MTTTNQDHADHDVHGGMGHAGHGWMMIACCIPMLIIAVVLVAAGVGGAGFTFAALMCAAMMWLMMRSRGARHEASLSGTTAFEPAGRGPTGRER